MHFNLQTIVTENENLVWNTVRGMKIIESNFDDCLQEGFMGLMQAAIRFDPKQECEFSTYAVPYIKGYVKKYLTKNRYVIRFPDRHVWLQSSVKKMQEKCQTNKEIADELQLSTEQIMILDTMNKIRSLDEKLNSDEDNSESLLNIVRDDIGDQYEKLVFEMAALDALESTLSRMKNPLHKQIYNDYITGTLYADEVVNTVTLSAKYGISKQAVAMILKKYNPWYADKLDLEKCS